MADILKELYDELLNIKSYLIKIGPSRRKGNILVKKLGEADSINVKYSQSLRKINESINLGVIAQDECKLISNYCNRFRSLYCKIVELCTEKTEAMEFNLKVALSLLPVLDGKTSTTDYLVDGIEYYASTLKNESKIDLINFVLKSRLNHSAKLSLNRTYPTVDALLHDMRKHLLPKKSAAAMQTKLQGFVQNELSINDYGQKITELFVDLTIAQANGNDNSYSVLKPVNEQQAIKRFADGLRNRRISTIIAARNFDNIKDAIQAAIDEEVSTPSTSNGILSMNPNKNFNYRQGRGRFNFNRNFRGRGAANYRGKQNYYAQGTYAANYGRSWGQTPPGNRGGSRSRPSYRGKFYHNNNFGNQRTHSQHLNTLTETEPQSEKIDTVNENKFFRS